MSRSIEQILAKLRMNGVVNSDPGVVERLDRYMQDKSVVIPVEKKKDGSFSARSGVLSREEMQLISSYVDAKIRSIGREILDGKIAANPYEKGNEEACTYCAYKKVAVSMAVFRAMRRDSWKIWISRR